MAEEKKTTAVAAETTADTQGGRHDRVAMLSVSKDGTPDQHDPQIIGEKSFALDSTKRQFAENAVSAVDDTRAAENAAIVGAETVGQDPTIAERQDEHAEAVKSAEAAAEKVVDALHEG